MLETEEQSRDLREFWMQVSKLGDHSSAQKEAMVSRQVNEIKTKYRKHTETQGV